MRNEVRNHMTIQEAARKAHELGTGIYRASEMESRTYIVPTNTCACCIVAGMQKERPNARWQPQLNDLLADDWVVYGRLGDELRQEVKNAD